MRPPRLRFTVRRLMTVVAVVAVLLGGFSLGRRSAYLNRLWLDHRREADRIARLAVTGSVVPSDRRSSGARFLWHCEMASKYGYAASHPWLPVEPDPPEPR
jgi:hypothetical protein